MALQRTSIGVPPQLESEGRAQPELTLLGTFRLTWGEESVRLPMSAQRLLAFLALRNAPALRVHVAACLWLDVGEARARANLRSALWRLLRPGHLVVETDGERLWLSPLVRVDVRELRETARAVLEQPDAGIEHATAVLMNDNVLLPDWYDDWLAADRDRLAHLRLHALERLCERLTRAGRFGEAVDAGHVAVAGDPLRESAHRALIEAYVAEGNVVDAVRSYRRCEELLLAELGVGPSERLRRLIPPGASTARRPGAP